MSIHSTARVGARSVRDKFGRDLQPPADVHEPSWREIQAGLKSADVQRAWESLSPALRPLAEVVDLVAEIKFGDVLHGGLA